MILERRRHREGDRFITIRLALFFLAAGIWVAGLLIEDSRVTGAAIVVLVVALVIGWIGRRRDR